MKKNTSELLKYWSYDCKIDLQKWSQLLFRLIYNLLQNELLTFKEYINENFVKNCFHH